MKACWKCSTGVSDEDSFCPKCGVKQKFSPSVQNNTVMPRRAKIAQAASLIAFVLPWLTVSCSQQTVAQISGFDLAAGAMKIRDPISGAMEYHTFAPSLIIWAAMMLIVFGLAAKLIFTEKRAANWGAKCSAIALVLLCYEAFMADTISAPHRSGVEGLLTSGVHVRLAFGFWLSCLALGFATFFNHRIYRCGENSRPQNWIRRALGVILIGCSLTFPSIFSAKAAERAAITVPSPSPTFETINFAENPGAKTISAQGVEVTVQPMKDGSDPDAIEATASIRIPGYQTIIVPENGGSAAVFDRQIGIGKLNTSDHAPSVLIQSFSGGAHCCADLEAVVPLAGKLKLIKFPSQDGDGLKSFPADIDHDGTVDFVFHDDRFQYQFASHAGSWSPPIIYNIYKGNLIDVSSQPAYAGIYRKFAAEVRTHCADRSNNDRNGACAAYVAAEARLGNVAQAMKEADALAYRGNGADLPSGCEIEANDGLCPPGKEIKFYTFSTALSWFLRKNGYTE